MKSFAHELKPLLLLAIPLILSDLINASAPFTSTIILAHLSLNDLAAGALASWFYATFMIVSWGIITAISVLVSRYHGANNHKAITQVLREALLFAALLSIPVSIIVWNMAPLLIAMGQTPSLMLKATPYLHYLATSVFADFIALAWLQFVIGLGHVRINLICACIWVPLNISLNVLFAFGLLGLPKMGMSGIGLSTSLSYWIIAIGLTVYCWYKPELKCYLQSLFSWQPIQYLKELFTVGIPIGLMWCVEISSFFAISLLLGLQGKQSLAAFQITMQFDALFVTIIFALSQAITVHMGEHLGAKRETAAYRSAFVGILLSLAIVLPLALFECLYPNQLIALDLNQALMHKPFVVQLTFRFFKLAALFLISESIRIALFGALRAYKDTRFTLITSVLAFWLIGVAGGYLVFTNTNLGPNSYWWSLIVGGLINMVLLFLRLQLKFKPRGYHASST